MKHKLYLNGQYLKTVELVAGFPSDFHWMFDLGGHQTRYVRSYCCEEDFIIIRFHEEGDGGLEGYYGIIDKKTEKKIRNRVKEYELWKKI